jgi:hypothetical protein
MMLYMDPTQAPTVLASHSLLHQISTGFFEHQDSSVTVAETLARDVPGGGSPSNSTGMHLFPLDLWTWAVFHRSSRNTAEFFSNVHNLAR